MSHLDEHGNARMVDVSAKQPERRDAWARGKILLRPETLEIIGSGEMKKGDVIAVARVAGIQAAKRTVELIPLCHQIALSHASVDFEIEPDGIVIRSHVSCTDRTGVEMEALTAVSVAALTIYDMCKAVDKSMQITDIVLEAKTKGAEGPRATETPQ